MAVEFKVIVPLLASKLPPLLQEPLVVKEPLEEAVVVALALLVKSPVTNIVGLLEVAVTYTPLLPSPMVKLPLVVKEPEPII